MLITAATLGSVTTRKATTKAIRRFALLRRTLRQLGIEDERTASLGHLLPRACSSPRRWRRVTEQIRAAWPARLEA